MNDLEGRMVEESKSGLPIGYGTNQRIIQVGGHPMKEYDPETSEPNTVDGTGHGDILDKLTTEVPAKTEEDQKYEVLTKQIELLSISVELATHSIETLIYAVNNLEKKNKKLKKRITALEKNVYEDTSELCATMAEHINKIESDIDRIDNNQRDHAITLDRHYKSIEHLWNINKPALDLADLKAEHRKLGR